MFENILHYNYQVVDTCWRSNDALENSRHRKKDGTGVCTGAPLFFHQCVCDPESDIRKVFWPKHGFSLVYLPQSIIPVWRKEYSKFYDPNETRITLHLKIAHGKHAKGHILTSEDHDQLRCEYPDKVLESTRGRLYSQVPDKKWRYEGTPRAGSHQYIVITTPGSYIAHLYEAISYRYQWSGEPDPPPSGAGSRRQIRFKNEYVPGVLPSWVVVDEFHLLKSMSKNSGPWEYIMDIRKWAQEVPSIVAMSGTPVSVGPADIKGPLMCLRDGGQHSQHSVAIDDLDKMNSRFNELLERNPTSPDMTTLISNFGALYRPLTLRRTEESLWFGDKILNLPAVHQKDINVAFPTQYRQALNDMTHRIADEVQRGPSSDGFKMHSFYRTITRQQLLASTIPWLVKFWSESQENREERLLAANYPLDHLDENGNWLSTNPFRALGNVYTDDIPLPKFRALDQIIKRVFKQKFKMLVFSQYIAVASFAQHVSLPASLLYIILCFRRSMVP